jgi:hypothetical protein
LERDPYVVKWMKRHGISIPWIDGQKHQRRYVPDFLVEYEDGRKSVIEVKDPSRVDSNDVQRKRKAAAAIPPLGGRGPVKLLMGVDLGRGACR